MFTHDIIKIKLSREGYLPNCPPHLISDKEMCLAFKEYFSEIYPLPHEQLNTEYNDLVEAIDKHLEELINDKTLTYKLPDWVYSYMLGTTIGTESDELEINDLLNLLEIPNWEQGFNFDVARACYKLSKDWISKLNYDRPPTLFGEPHVIKLLRLNKMNN